MAFFSDALGHSALTGIAIGVIFGIKQPLWSMIFFSILLSVIIMVVKNANTASTDTIIGVFSSTALALGIVILSLKGGFQKYSIYLIGDLLSIDTTDLLISIQWVGILIISSLLILPAAAARNISKNMRQYHIYSVSIAVISGLSGLLLSYFWGSATGATIVLISSGFFMGTFLIKLKFN